MKLPNAQVRQWIYGVIVAALAVLAGYKIIEPTSVPLWLSLAGTALGIVGTGTAAVAVASQRNDGTLP